MVTGFTDLTPQASELQTALLRDLPAWRKLEMLAELNASARLLALAGLRARFPEASEAELERQFFALRQGEEATFKIFGK